MRIAFIGCGEAAQTFSDGRESAARGRAAFAAYNVLFVQDGPCRAEAERWGVRVHPSTSDAVAGADWVVSGVTAASSLEAAVAAIGPNQVYVDINSVSSATKRQCSPDRLPGWPSTSTWR